MKVRGRRFKMSRIFETENCFAVIRPVDKKCRQEIQQALQNDGKARYEWKDDGLNLNRSKKSGKRTARLFSKLFWNFETDFLIREKDYNRARLGNHFCCNVFRLRLRMHVMDVNDSPASDWKIFQRIGRWELERVAWRSSKTERSIGKSPKSSRSSSSKIRIASDFGFDARLFLDFVACFDCDGVSRLRNVRFFVFRSFFFWKSENNRAVAGSNVAQWKLIVLFNY